MTGNNEIRLNQAELNAAVTLYLKTKVLNTEYSSNVIVEGVDHDGNSYSKTWVVKLAEIQAAEVK